MLRVSVPYAPGRSVAPLAACLRVQSHQARSILQCIQAFSCPARLLLMDPGDLLARTLSQIRKTVTATPAASPLHESDQPCQGFLALSIER